MNVFVLSLIVPLLLIRVLHYALNGFSYSRLERFSQVRSRSDRYEAILKDDDEMDMALGVWSLLLWIGIGFFIYFNTSAPEVTPGIVIISGYLFLWWVSLGILELCILRPVANVFAEPLLFYFWPFMNIFRLVVTPLSIVSSWIRIALERIAGIKDNGESTAIEEELLSVVTEGEREGSIGEEKAQMIEGLIELSKVAVSDIMTPRTDIVMLHSNSTVQEAADLIIQNGHSRIPVYEESRDKISGILYAKDLLPNLSMNSHKRLDELDHMDLRTPIYVPETKRVDQLLEEIRKIKVHLAIILDEYGGVSGLVTIEDILEQIVGEIEDEHDPEELPHVQQIEEDVYEVDARVHVDQLRKEIPELRYPVEMTIDTLGGFVFSSLGHIPEIGEQFTDEFATYSVIDVTDRAIVRVRIQLLTGNEALQPLS